MQLDRLTDLPIRTAFEADLAAAVAAESAVSLALMDVNNFHDINQTFGTDTADCVLITLTNLFKEQNPGRIYRIAGDEFAVIMADSVLEQAFLKMEGVRKTVQD